MAYHPRIESSTLGSFLTTRSRNSELWFANNPQLEAAILGYAAKFSLRYEVTLYALAIEGNHIQTSAKFPKENRSHYMRDFNSCVARALPRHSSTYPGGRFWGRRYSSEILPDAADIEENFFYTVLQPVQDGLVERISEYPGYNCFHDAVHGIERKFTVVHWAEYNAAKRRDDTISISDYLEVVKLKYARLPGYEDLSQGAYARLMQQKLEARQRAIVEKRMQDGQGFAGRAALLRVRPGSVPKFTKTSERYSHRPRILCVCPERRSYYKSWYFSIYFEYRNCSKRYRSGELSVKFPQGTYRPYLDIPRETLWRG